MGRIIVIATLAVIGAAIAPRFLSQMNGNQVLAVAAQPDPAPAPASNSRSISITKGANGHFNVEANVDGRRIAMLVDTGASVIALRETEARRLGVHPSRSEYTATAHTANGIVKAAPVRLNRVEVGDVVVRDVAAFVLPDEALGQNLLGMSFLGKVRWEHRKGKLVLEQ
jgi:aspartyl protease family protein